MKIIKNKAAFNVNSTSVDAWTAVLSGTLGVKRPLLSGELDGELLSFSRYQTPVTAVKTKGADPDQSGGWVGAREFSNDEIRTLASNIVNEVKKRGPFVSLADFINRRLTDEQSDESRMGVLDAAIKASGLNEGFEKNSEYLSTAVNVGVNPDSPDNNLSTFKESYRYPKDGAYTTVQPVSQAWGMPGFLTQGDILEPIAPALSVRGDTYTIRAYGESTRSPEYVDSSANGNSARDSALLVDYGTGEYTEGGLSKTNLKFGRKFIIKSVRWLSPDEI